MRKLKVISFFFTLLMLIQVVPVQQIGQALGQSVWTEELPHNNECGIDDAAAKAFLPVISYYHAFDVEATSADNYIHQHEAIPSNHSTDVVTPPPDVRS